MVFLFLFSICGLVVCCLSSLLDDLRLLVLVVLLLLLLQLPVSLRLSSLSLWSSSLFLSQLFEDFSSVGVVTTADSNSNSLA